MLSIVSWFLLLFIAELKYLSEIRDRSTKERFKQKSVEASLDRTTKVLKSTSKDKRSGTKEAIFY
jgi:hypothetical protein